MTTYIVWDFKYQLFMDLISYVRMYSGAQSMERPKFQDMITLPQSGGRADYWLFLTLKISVITPLVIALNRLMCKKSKMFLPI